MSYIWLHRLGRHLREYQRDRSPAMEIRNSGRAMALQEEIQLIQSWGISCRQPAPILELLQTRERRVARIKVAPDYQASPGRA